LVRKKNDFFSIPSRVSPAVFPLSSSSLPEIGCYLSFLLFPTILI